VADAHRLAGVLARAFDDDPVMTWMFPDHTLRVRRSRRFFGVRLKHLLPQGEVYTTDGLAGGALWALPGRWRLRPLEVLELLAVLAPALGPRGPRALHGLRLVESRHPTAAHYYLATLGTEPERQGLGIGSALMAPVLESCDADEIPAYLESSKERNVAFYARHGFRVMDEIRLPKGPPLWGMWREPRP
jgi:GNAT superfamily N-acetyltransferase